MISVNQKTLLSALKAAKGVADKRPSMPVLACVHLAASNGTLRIASTDLTVTLVTEIAALGELSACVDLTALLSAVTAQGKGATLTIDNAPNAVKVSGSADMTVRALDANDFPALPVVAVADSITYDAPSLLGALDFVSPAVSTDVTRYHLNGLLLDADKMVSTDGHRLHLQSGLPSTGGASYLIPRKGAVVLAKALKSHKANTVGAFGGGFARFTVGATTITIKLIDAQFPPYAQVMPNVAYCDGGFTAKRGEFLSAVKSAAALSSDKTWGVKLNVEGASCAVEVDNPDVGESRAPFAGMGRNAKPWRIGMNAKYIIEAVESLTGDEITMVSDGELDPVRIDHGDRTAVIMPMRI